MTYDKMTDVERVARAIEQQAANDWAMKVRDNWQGYARAAIAALQSAAPVEDDVREMIAHANRDIIYADGLAAQLDADGPLSERNINDLIAMVKWNAAALIERLSSTGGATEPSESLVRECYDRFMHGAEYPCSASAMREVINLAMLRVSQDGKA